LICITKAGLITVAQLFSSSSSNKKSSSGKINSKDIEVQDELEIGDAIYLGRGLVSNNEQYKLVIYGTGEVGKLILAHNDKIKWTAASGKSVNFFVICKMERDTCICIEISRTYCIGVQFCQEPM